MRDAWRRFLEHRLAVAAAGCLLVAFVVALLAPVIAPYDPLAMTDAQMAAPGAEHWLGTDQLARDVLSRVIYGARISIRVAALAVAIALVAGTAMGLVAGYFGGITDGVVSRVMDVMFSLPTIVMALVIMAVLGKSLTNVTIAIGIVYTPIFARVCRGAVLSVKEKPYVEAVEAMGASNFRIMVRHILPNIAAPLIVQTTLSFAFAVLAEAALSFLGLSGEADIPSWGKMLYDGYQNMPLGAWWMVVFPGLAITLAVLAFNVLGDGLQDALDPKGKDS